MTFDITTKSPAEIRAEANRRKARRAAGLPLVEDDDLMEAAPTWQKNALPGVRHITLPWSVLVSDNNKYLVVRGRLQLTTTYRGAKKRARQLVAQQMAGMLPLGKVPCAIEARMFEPDRHRGRDVANFAKMVHDALNELAYADDKYLDDVHWIREAPDVDRPRLEITVRVMTIPTTEATP